MDAIFILIIIGLYLATHWLAAALCHFAPADYRWLLQLDRGTLS